MPGLIGPDGVLRRDKVVSVSGNFIVGNMVGQRGNINEAWEFLKWFTDAPAQSRFAADAEAVWGHNWRYLTANLEAFMSLGWSEDNLQILDEALEWLVAIPQVPGGYIAGRATNNAFLSVILDNRNPIDAVFLARDQIDNELAIKRREFMLD